MRKLTTGVALTATFIVVTATALFGWQSVELDVQGDGCERAIVTATNPEQQPAQITAQTGGVFAVGDVIPSHGTLDRVATGTEDITVSITVNFPDHASASTVVPLDECPPEETTTTTEPTSSTVSLIPPVTLEREEPQPTAPKFTG